MVLREEIDMRTYDDGSEGGEMRPFLLDDGDTETEFTSDNESAASYGASKQTEKSSSKLDHSMHSSDQIPDRPDGASNFSTIMNLLKANVGSGCLALPAAFANAGVLVGSLGIMIVGFMAIHCMHLLVTSSQHLCRQLGKAHLSYCEVVEESVLQGPAPLRKHANKARNMVNALLCISHFGFCSAYFLLIGKNLKLIVENSIGNNPEDSLTYIPNYPMRVQLYETLLLLVIIPLVFIKNIKHLGILSALANLCALAGLAIIMFYILFHGEMGRVSRLDWYKDITKLPLFFGTLIYSYEGIGVVLPLENKMREPRMFNPLFGVLDLTMTIVLAFFMTVAFYGYVEFGDHIEASITLNLQGWFGLAVQALFCFNIYISYGLMFYVPMDIIKDHLHNEYMVSKLGTTTVDNLIRTAFVIMTFLFAVVVDEYLDLLISLVGSVGAAGLSLFIPALLDIITFWPDRKTKRCFSLTMSKNVFIILFALIGAVTGTAVSIHQLVVKLRKVYGG